MTSAAAWWSLAVGEIFSTVPSRGRLFERGIGSDQERALVHPVHERSRTTRVPLNQVPFEQLCPGADALAVLQAAYR